LVEFATRLVNSGLQREDAEVAWQELDSPCASLHRDIELACSEKDVVPMVTVWLSPLWIAMLYDWLRHRIVHRVYVFGALLLILLRYRQVVRDSDAWGRFLHWLAERLM
jgi:hypothetical protein